MKKEKTLDRNSIRNAYDKQDYPELKLEDGEVVELVFKRAKICYMLIWLSVAILAIVVIFTVLVFIFSGAVKDKMGENFVSFISIALFIVLIICGLVETIIYSRNKLFVTNKRVTQFTMVSPIVSSVNIIDLSSIEDVSFHQNKLIEKLFHFGTLRLATVGDETTYTFRCVKVSPEEVSRIVKLVNDDKEKQKS